MNPESPNQVGSAVRKLELTIEGLIAEFEKDNNGTEIDSIFVDRRKNGSPRVDVTVDL